MRDALKFAALAVAAGLSACAIAPPSSPTVSAIPGAGKNFAQFQGDEAACRQFASTRVPPNVTQVSQQNSLGTTIGTTALAAGAGALIGSTVAALGTGAAVGAGVGLLLGTALAADQFNATAAGVQQGYDVAYEQCMTARGDQVSPPAGYGYPSYYGQSGYYAGYPGPYYAPYPAYYGGYAGFGGPIYFRGGYRWR